MKPGIHFEDSFSPVAADDSHRMIIGISLYVINSEIRLGTMTIDVTQYILVERTKPGASDERFNQICGDELVQEFWDQLGIGADQDSDNEWIVEVYDVEAAFLNAQNGVELHIDVPEAEIKLGIITEEEADEILYRLCLSMYGNVDAALRFFLLYKEILIKLGFKQLLSDPCVFILRNERDEIVVISSIHVDDTLIAGRKKEVYEFYDRFEEHLKIDRLGRLKKHLGVWYEWCIDDRNNIFLKASMERMRESIISNYEKYTGTEAKKYQSPGVPGSKLLKNQGEPVDMTNFRKVMGQLLYFTNKIAPSMCNASRELSSHMSNPNADHWTAMGRVVGHLKAFDKFEMIFRSPEELRPIIISDAEYATNPEDRKSVGGEIDTLGGMLTNWSSKKQQIVALSSSESELIQYAKCCQTGMFMQNFLEELFEKKQPVVIFEDNQGCIYLVKNQKVGGRTKHIDVRNLFIRDLYANRTVIPAFCRSAECIADGCTKHQPEKLYCEHAHVLMNGVLPYRREDVKSALRSIKSNHPDDDFSAHVEASGAPGNLLRTDEIRHREHKLEMQDAQSQEAFCTGLFKARGKIEDDDRSFPI
jgi:hypothetical protein